MRRPTLDRTSDADRRAGTGTRLGRPVRAPAAMAAVGWHREPHQRTNWLRDVILGGQDGLVNILGIILGRGRRRRLHTVLLATGFAAAITESISMGGRLSLLARPAGLLPGRAGTGGGRDRHHGRSRACDRWDVGSTPDRHGRPAGDQLPEDAAEGPAQQVAHLHLGAAHPPVGHRLAGISTMKVARPGRKLLFGVLVPPLPDQPAR